MADTIHGFEIHALFKTEGGRGLRPGRIILVDRGKTYPERWVSSWQGDGDDEWSQGHYFGKFEDAQAHFLKTCKGWIRASEP